MTVEQRRALNPDELARLREEDSANFIAQANAHLEAQRTHPVIGPVWNIAQAVKKEKTPWASDFFFGWFGIRRITPTIYDDALVEIERRLRKLDGYRVITRMRGDGYLGSVLFEKDDVRRSLILNLALGFEIREIDWTDEPYFSA